MNKSRYDFMEDSSVKDEVTGNLFPDPLSINYLNFKMNSLPKKDVMTEPKIILFWKETEIHYNTPYLDDIVLTLNGVSHKNFIRTGDTIFFPEVSDIFSSFGKER